MQVGAGSKQVNQFIGTCIEKQPNATLSVQGSVFVGEVPRQAPSFQPRQDLGDLGDGRFGAVRVRDALWSHLGVHHPIEVEGADIGTLPAYVPRDVDSQQGTGLRDRLAVAAKGGGFVVLVGGSSTGKTRSLYEAMRALFGDWWVLQPADLPPVGAVSLDPASRGAASLAELAGTLPSSLVIWLDDLQNYMGSDGLEASTVRRLINGGAVLVGTMWPHLHDQYMTPPSMAFAAGNPGDPHQEDRELLQLAEVIHLPLQPTEGENGRARDLAETANGGAGDARLKAALKVTGFGFTQTIAAAPQLVDRWNNADPYARAVLTAAIDASRLGARSPLPMRFLRDAAPGYCSPAERGQARPDWFDRALAYGTRLLLGAVAPLTPVGVGMTMGAITGYELADYLADHVEAERRPHSPPATFWDACIAHLADPGDLERIGNNAADRMRYRYAIPLLRRSGSRDSYTATRLAFLVGDQGHVDEAIAILRSLAEAGDPIAEYQLADVRQHSDEYRASAKRDIPSPAQKERLLKGLQGSRHLRRKTDNSRIRALAIEMFGDVDDLRRRYRTDSSDINSAYRLVNLLACTGDFAEMRPILHALVDRGDIFAHDQLVANLVELGRSKEALNLARFGLSADGHIESRRSQVQPTQ